MAPKNLRGKITHLLDHGLEEVIRRSSLEEKLLSGKKLIVKLGADPSSADLHLGHAVVLRKLKEFQDLGHRAMFIIGDFTARIGDPSGRSAARKVITEAEVRKNAKIYLRQAGKILNVRKAKIRMNSEWFSKMKLDEFIGVAGRFSLSRISEREDFKKRIASGGEVGLHEALYQVLQAYDSLAIKADVELGGRDQKLNLLAGREFQRKLGHRAQDLVIVPLLIGLDGKQKMSKSLGNYIGLDDRPEDMFGKVMAIPDSLIVHYGELAAFLERDELSRLALDAKASAYQAKQSVARKITALYWGEKKAGMAMDTFHKRFAQKGENREVYKEKKLPRKKYSLVDLVMALGPTSSRSEARRLIVGRAVEIDKKVALTPASVIFLDRAYYVRIGKKKFVKAVPQKNPA